MVCRVQHDLIAFQRRYGVEAFSEPTFPDKERFLFRFGHLTEELNELKEAWKRKDLDEIADALVDLTYIAVGSALEWGINFEEVWAEVHRANMSKVRASPDGSDSKRGSGLDIVKPEGWIPPNVHDSMWKPIRDPTLPILARAHAIIDTRSEEAERQYGSMRENCEHAAQIASIMQRQEFIPSDVIAVLVGLKLARHRRSYKEDSLLDAAAYIGGLDNLIKEVGDDRGDR